MSSVRAKLLHDLQLELMKEMDVPVLDLYRTTYLSAEWLYPGDGRHYRKHFNHRMVESFFNSNSR